MKVLCGRIKAKEISYWCVIMAKLSEKAYELRKKYNEKFGYYPRGWAHGEETMEEYEKYLEEELSKDVKYVDILIKKTFAKGNEVNQKYWNDLAKEIGTWLKSNHSKEDEKKLKQKALLERVFMCSGFSDK